MLRRFMNWLLHQLQKLLGALSGRRSNSRPFTSASDASNATATQKTAPAPTDAPPSTPADISFSIQSARSQSAHSQSARSPVQQSIVSQADAIQKADDAIDTHMRLNAASAAVSDSQSDLSDSKVNQNDPLPLNESIADIQSANQLPSIHDLLPAVEQEIKANSVHFDDDEAPADLGAAVSHSVSSKPEDDDSDDDSDEVAEPVQALLFSFDIVERASEEESVVEEEVAEPVQLAFSPSESISEEVLLETAIAPSPLANLDLASNSQVQPPNAPKSPDEILPQPSPASDSDTPDSDTPDSDISDTRCV